MVVEIQKGKNIKGMTIGLAMNSVYYYKKEKDGSTFSKKLDDSEVKKQGKQMASEILSRLRENDDLKDIPIHFAIYKQSSEDSITPGEFITQATAERVKQSLMNGIISMKNQLYYLLQQQQIMMKI